MNLIQRANEIKLDRIEVRLNKHKEVLVGSVGYTLDITFYFDDRPTQPFSVREFRAGSRLHISLTEIEEHIRRDFEIDHG